MLDMQDASSEILGFLENDVYFDSKAGMLASAFNAEYQNETDPFSPVMVSLKEQGNMGSYLDYIDLYVVIFVGIFVMAMSVVLWNTGLLGGLRRYQEFGIRLALGESKGEIFRSLVTEAILIGTIGSVSGTIIGLICTWFLQVHGIDIGSMTANSTIMMPSVIRSKVTPDLLYIGFIPGLFAMVLGNILSGIGIFKRETAQLFKELEV
jgi:putative ABC transport system permease protein